MESSQLNAIDRALSRVPQIDGMVGAVLVEASTGHVVGVRGPGPGAGPGHDAAADDVASDTSSTVLAAAATDLVHTLTLFAARQAGTGLFDELIVAFREQHHVIRPLQAPGHEGLFLVVTLDRRRANLALARHQMQALESQILA